MADLNQLSDEEIRTQLQRYGYYVGPVTEHTRNIFIQRLRQLMSKDGEKNTKSSTTLRLSRLSSGEETDETEATLSNRSTRRKKKSPRYSANRASFRNSRSSSDTTDTCIISAFRVPVIRSPRKIAADIVTGDARARLLNSGRNTDCLPGLESTESDESDVQPKSYPRRTFGTSDSTRIYQSKAFDAHGKLSYPEVGTWRLVPFLRNVFNPLGYLATACRRSSQATNSRSENNGFIPQPRSSNGDYQDSGTSDNFLTTEERNWFSRNCQVVPNTLVLIMMVFFLGLALSYAALGKVKAFRSHTGNNFPICVKKVDKPLKPCVLKHRLPAAVNLTKIIYPLVEEKTCKYACSSLYGDVAPEQTLLTKSDLIVYLKEISYSYKPADIENMEILISSNPHWGISINRKSEEVVMYVLRPMRTPVTCYLKYLLHWFVQRLVQAAICAVVIFVLFKLLTAYKAHADTHRRNVRGMVARITKFLRAEYDSSAEEPFFVVIDYVRDQLIPPHDQKRLAFVWTSAVNYIKHNDPHIKEEKCIVNGELKTVWRWLPKPGSSASEPSYPSKHSSLECHSIIPDDKVPGLDAGDTPIQQKTFGSPNHRSGRIWQGQAFETMAGSPNSVPCSPTPCLKIRHMFDPDAEHGQDWPIFIRDAILEKCEGVAILHLFVDKTSREGCVYVKCRTPEDAGRAYCALHGWWFGNSHLVTVKYLRIERYHERFPEAVNASAVLKPSNYQRLSVGE